MRIAIFHELPYGGARRAINEYAKEFKKNHSVDLFIVNDKKNKSEEKFYSKIYFFSFIARNWKGNDWKTRIYKDSIELVSLYRLNREIASAIDRNKYDIVLVSASKYIEAPFIMRFLKTPFIFFLHDPFYRIIYDPMLKISKDLDFIRYNYERLNRFVRKILDRQNINKANLCILPSRFIANIFYKTYKKPYKIVYYGVNTSSFKPKKIDKDIDIFYIGSDHPMDGYSFFLESVNIMKSNPKIKTILTNKEWISNDSELIELYQRSKVNFCSSYSEGLGAISLESMACGVPVIAVNEAGYKETIIDGVTGYLLPRDSRVFARKIDWLLSHPKEIEKMGNNARKIMMRDWSWNSRSIELLNVFKDYILNKKK